MSEKSSTHVLSGQIESENAAMPTASSGPILDNAVLAFIKAYRLRGGVNSLKKVICERFSSEVVDRAKKALWDFCDHQLENTNLVFHARRDSDKRSQCIANLDDILKAFEVLDADNLIPLIFCEASDLLRLPPLSLDPIGEQVHANSEVLVTLKSSIASLELKIGSLIESYKSTAVSCNTHHHSTGNVSEEQLQQPNSYAQTTAMVPPPSTSSITTSIRQSMPYNRDTNVVLFGLPETRSLVESKEVVDEVFEFLAGKPVHIKDIFRLGKFKQSARPRPLLVKLSDVWDRKLLLIKKKNLRHFRIERLYVREDVPPDHKLHQNKQTQNTKDVGQPAVGSHDSDSRPKTVSRVPLTTPSSSSSGTDIPTDTSKSSSSIMALPIHETGKPQPIASPSYSHAPLSPNCSTSLANSLSSSPSSSVTIVQNDDFA